MVTALLSRGGEGDDAVHEKTRVRFYGVQNQDNDERSRLQEGAHFHIWGLLRSLDMGFRV